MKYFKHILIILAVLISLKLSADNGYRQDSVDCSNVFSLDWAFAMGGTNNDVSLDVCTDLSGNIIITGYFYDTFEFADTSLVSQGDRDIFLIKLTPQGDLIWAQRAGGDGFDEGKGVICDSDGNIYLSGTVFTTGTFGEQEYFGYAEKDSFIAKFNTEGELLNIEIFGGWGNDEGVDIELDNQGNVLIAGNYEDAMAIGTQTLNSNGGRDFFAAKYNSDMEFQWVTNHGSNQDDFASSIAVDYDGNIFVGGSFSGTMTAGAFSMDADGMYDGFIASYNPDGFIRWMVNEGTDADNDLIHSLTTDYNGNVLVTGYLQLAENTLFISKYDNNGLFKWREELGGSAIAEGLSIKSANNGNIMLAGRFSGVANFGGGNTGSLGGYDLFILSLSPDADYLWGRFGGSPSTDEINAICFDNEQSIIGVGSCYTPIYIEGVPFNGNGLSEALVMRLQKAISMGSISISGIDCNENNLCAQIDMLTGTPPYSYYWSTGDNEDSICGLSVGDYTLTVVDDAGCYIDTTINIFPPNIPVINLPDLIEICPYDTLELDAGEGMQSYNWSTGENTQSIIVNQGGNYSVTVENEFGCQNSHTLDVTQISEPDLILADTVYICQGDSTLVSVVDSYNSIEWSTGATSQSVTLYQQGVYRVTVADVQCVYYDTVRLLYYPQPNVDLGGDQYICEGDSIVFDAGDAYESYLWQNGSSNQTFTLFTPGSVMVTVTDINGCSDSDSVNLSFATNPEIDLGEDIAECADIDIVIDAGPGYESYIWNNNLTDQSIIADQTGTYSVTVTNSESCTNSDEIYVEIYELPDIDLGEDIEFCAQSSYIISVAGDYNSYIWNTGANTPNLPVNTSGTYSVSVTNSHGCTAADSVEVIAHPVSPPDLGDTIVVCDSTTIFITPEQEYEEYLWSNGSHSSGIFVSDNGNFSLTVTDDNACSSVGSVSVIYAEAPTISEVYSTAGTLIVEAEGGNPPYVFSIDGEHWQHGTAFGQLETDFYDVYVIDSLTCSDTINVYVDNILVIPEYFTPNSDGFNDRWEIGGIYQYPNAQITIFDRFGKKLIEYKGNQPGWNGFYAGQPAPADTYWYIISVNRSIEFKGPVTIVR
ncbi:MAG: T9SS type B sorting domain-containing protein [Bacteroidales bacterium]|nr:T9SS type B sorting domain-containing protein [Bacteroidales bacterium]